MNLEKFDLYKVLCSNLTKDYILFLNHMLEGIGNKSFQQLKFEGKEKYYVVNIPNFTRATQEITSNSDNILRKVKNLETMGYVIIKMGQFVDGSGYSRTAIALTEKVNELLNDK